MYRLGARTLWTSRSLAAAATAPPAPTRAHPAIPASLTLSITPPVTAVTVPRRVDALARRYGRQRRPKVVVLSGGTGVGKTALSLLLAASLPGGGEVVSADSMQVYQGLDIGTAKASRDELAALPHHLIDIVAPGGDDYSAARFHRDAMTAIKVRHSSLSLHVFLLS